MILGRKDDQCSKRYTEMLNPSAETRLREWTQEEDRILAHGVRSMGHRWAVISACLDNRPPLTCRNRWHSISSRAMGEAEANAEAVQSVQPTIVAQPQATDVLNPPSFNSNATDTLDQLNFLPFEDSHSEFNFMSFLPMTPIEALPEPLVSQDEDTDDLSTAASSIGVDTSTNGYGNPGAQFPSPESPLPSFPFSSYFSRQNRQRASPLRTRPGDAQALHALPPRAGCMRVNHPPGRFMNEPEAASASHDTTRTSTEPIQQHGTVVHHYHHHYHHYHHYHHHYPYNDTRHTMCRQPPDEWPWNHTDHIDT